MFACHIDLAPARCLLSRGTLHLLPGCSDDQVWGSLQRGRACGLALKRICGKLDGLWLGIVGWGCTCQGQPMLDDAQRGR
eukprot:4251022-Alexandrium_andersonii.AAC.1